MIRVLIGDDHPVVREGLKRILGGAPDMTVVADVATSEEVLRRSAGGDVDVVLLDIGMPGPGFLETLHRLSAGGPPVLVLSVHPEDQYAVRAFKAGAAGYLTKDHAPAELLTAVRRVSGGGRYVTPTIAEKLAAVLKPGATARPHEALSEREFQVLLALAAGTGANVIASELGVSPKTVSTYRSRVLSKLGLRSNVELVRYALQHRLIPGAPEPEAL